jgi:hypothetical protein
METSEPFAFLAHNDTNMCTEPTGVVKDPQSSEGDCVNQEQQDEAVLTMIFDNDFESFLDASGTAASTSSNSDSESFLLEHRCPGMMIFLQATHAPPNNSCMLRCGRQLPP